MGIVSAAAQENPVVLGTRRIERRELAEERISWEVRVAAQIQLQNVTFDKARRVPFDWCYFFADEGAEAERG